MRLFADVLNTTREFGLHKRINKSVIEYSKPYKGALAILLRWFSLL